MKIKAILFMILLTAHAEFIAQPLPLEFSMFDDDYAALQNDTVFSDDDWDDGYWQIPIGFDFHYMQQVYDYVYFFGPFGGFGSELCLGQYVEDGVYDVMCPALLDVKDANGDELSTMSYVTEGTAPSRIFKLQWANCALVGDKSGTTRVNYQIWLYETSNCVEFRYGPSVDFNAVVTGFIGVPVFLGNNWVSTASGNNCAGLWNMNGDVDDPDFNFSFSTNNLYSEVHLDDLPAENTVYRFCGDSTMHILEMPTDVKIFPTIARSEIFIQSSVVWQHVVVLDACGKKLFRHSSNGLRSAVDVSNLTSGVYYLQLYINGSLITRKFIKE